MQGQMIGDKMGLIMHSANVVIIVVCIGPGLVSREQIGVVRVEQMAHPLVRTLA